MDLYHTTSGTKMKQEIAQRYSTRLDLAQTNVAIVPSPPPGVCPGAATERHASIQVVPAARQIQPIRFPGRLEAIRAPKIGKERKYRPQRRAYAPCTPTTWRPNGKGGDLQGDSNEKQDYAERGERPGKPWDGPGTHPTGSLLRSLVSSLTTQLYSATVSQTSRKRDARCEVWVDWTGGHNVVQPLAWSRMPSCVKARIQRLVDSSFHPAGSTSASAPGGSG